MRGVTIVSFPHFWWKNHLSRSELILKTHHNHSLPRSKRELASFYRGRIVPASIDRKLVNNDDVPHGVAVDIFGPKKNDQVKSTLAQLSTTIFEGSLLIFILSS